MNPQGRPADPFPVTVHMTASGATVSKRTACMSAPAPKRELLSENKNNEFASCGKVAASFLELFSLLEEYAPTWYTFEHHNRAATAKLLLDSSVQETASDAAGEKYPDHLELHYACKILYLAVRCAIGSERPLPQRLLNCYLDFSLLDLRRRLPPDLRQRFDAMMNALSCLKGQKEGQRSATTTIAEMDDQEVRSWLDEILNLLLDANRLHARAERP